MISKTNILELELENINGVFDYVLESIINGQKEQAQNLVDMMSTRQRNWFEQYLEDCPFHWDYIEIARGMLDK